MLPIYRIMLLTSFLLLIFLWICWFYGIALVPSVQAPGRPVYSRILPHTRNLFLKNVVHNKVFLLNYRLVGHVCHITFVRFWNYELNTPMVYQHLPLKKTQPERPTIKIINLTRSINTTHLIFLLSFILSLNSTWY